MSSQVPAALALRKVRFPDPQTHAAPGKRTFRHPLAWRLNRGRPCLDADGFTPLQGGFSRPRRFELRRRLPRFAKREPAQTVQRCNESSRSRRRVIVRLLAIARRGHLGFRNPVRQHRVSPPTLADMGDQRKCLSLCMLRVCCCACPPSRQGTPPSSGRPVDDAFCQTNRFAVTAGGRSLADAPARVVASPTDAGSSGRPKLPIEPCRRAGGSPALGFPRQVASPRQKCQTNATPSSPARPLQRQEGCMAQEMCAGRAKHRERGGDVLTRRAGDEATINRKATAALCVVGRSNSRRCRTRPDPSWNREQGTQNGNEAERVSAEGMGYKSRCPDVIDFPAYSVARFRCRCLSRGRQDVSSLPNFNIGWFVLEHANLTSYNTGFREGPTLHGVARATRGMLAHKHNRRQPCRRLPIHQVGR